MHYQFAILPLESQEDAEDYSANMADIADLNLDWQFADDLLEAPEEIVFDELTSGWYQVFVRVVYDPDVSDDYDVYSKLYDNEADGTPGLATLRAAYDAALAAASDSAISIRSARLSQPVSDLKSVDAEDTEAKAEAEAALRTALGGTKAEQDGVIALADTWYGATTGRSEAYDAYRTALTELITQIATP